MTLARSLSIAALALAACSSPPPAPRRERWVIDVAEFSLEAPFSQGAPAGFSLSSPAGVRRVALSSATHGPLVQSGTPIVGERSMRMPVSAGGAALSLLVEVAGPAVSASIEGDQGELMAEIDGPGVPFVAGQPVALEGVARGAPLLLLTPQRALSLRAEEASFKATPTRVVARGKVVAIEASELREGLAGKLSTPLPGADALVVAFDGVGKTLGAAVPSGEGAFFLPEGTARAAAFLGASMISPLVDVAGAVPVEIAPLPLGQLVVQVVDHDTGKALPARIVVHGKDGTREPNFGPAFRANGAGPMVDREDGKLATTLPAGRYEVLATRGLEHTVARKVIELSAGARAEVRLGLRRVVDTPGWAGADLHVHSRGSFDSLVAIEDRVRSLMAAGIDFAAASEHNRVGSYATALVEGQEGHLTWVPSVEVTTLEPLRGHFNVLPWGLDEPPKHRRTSLAELVDTVRKKSPTSLVQVNHPRMGRIGHFNQVHLDATTSAGVRRLSRGFDTVEIYNGFDLGDRGKTEALVGEWLSLFEQGRTHWGTGNSDSHTVQYVSAGYPRTYVKVGHDHDGGEGPALDVAGLIEGLRAGQAQATSGPFVEVSQEGRGPGQALSVVAGKARLRVKVRAAPWVSVAMLEVRVGGKVALTREIKAVAAGDDLEGTLGEARARAVRFDDEVEVPVHEGAKAVSVIVRGERSVGETLPFMDWVPAAYVNPMLVASP